MQGHHRVPLVETRHRPCRNRSPDEVTTASKSFASEHAYDYAPPSSTTVRWSHRGRPPAVRSREISATRKPPPPVIFR
ncbi:hypothetical protein F2Q69_00036472 [Brassica cretica]|uniref:Uncharacterized protein n=1 Tax=Brassica cretica TaxID=69181 RepID=A0A8S9SG43_BRACR|nr:hypothetical protein F2Q69_00036472 [Brassica cretica]